MEQTRVDDGIWVPEHIKMRAKAKYFLREESRDRWIVTDSECRRTEARAPRPEIP